MKAKLFRVHLRDITKGIILAVITAVITFAISELQSGSAVDIALLKRMGVTALISFLSYILKNFLTNSKDEFVTAEPK